MRRPLDAWAVCAPLEQRESTLFGALNYPLPECLQPGDHRAVPDDGKSRKLVLNSGSPSERSTLGSALAAA
jgi:hypothetical protein